MSLQANNTTLLLPDLPDEILDTILQLLNATSLLNITRVNRRLNQLTASCLPWKIVACSDFRYWHYTHDFAAKVNAPATQTDWHDLVRRRCQLEQVTIGPNFEAAIRSPLARIRRLQNIADCGYDARDFLLRQLDQPPEDDDCDLSRAYWATKALGYIDHREAVREMVKVRYDPDYVPLERALACLDLCILDRPPLTLDDVDRLFATMANRFRHENAHDFDDLNTVQLAKRLTNFLKSRNMMGFRTQRSYNDLQNSCITIALLEHDHPSLPLVSSAIFCAIARRIGLYARLINYPRVVHTLVSAPPGRTLHGELTDAVDRPYSNPKFHLYLDLLADNPPKTYDALLDDLRRLHFPVDQRPLALAPASVSNMLLRAVNNVQHSREMAESFYARVLGDPATEFLPTDGSLDIRPTEAGYVLATLTINLFRVVVSRNPAAVSFIPGFSKYAMEMFFLDPDTAQHTFSPLLPHRDALWEDMRPDLMAQSHTADLDIRAATATAFADDAARPAPKRRTPHPDAPPGSRDPLHGVGTYFKHRRYEYYGVITAWDRRCQAPEHWMAAQGVDALPRGRSQVFYNVCDENGSMRYVAEENIVLVAPGPPKPEHPHPGVRRVAGRWCRRWDPTRRRFVGNLQEEYPDDEPTGDVS